MCYFACNSMWFNSKNVKEYCVKSLTYIGSNYLEIEKNDCKSVEPLIDAENVDKSLFLEWYYNNI